MTTQEFISLPQYSLEKNEKESILNSFLNSLYSFHLSNSKEYEKIVLSIFSDKMKPRSVKDFPFLPVNAFKNFELKSVHEEDIIKVLTSSGTTGTVPSKIFLDSETSKLQTAALSKIMGHVLGKERLPMLIIDSKEVLKNRLSFSARGAGILGYSIFGKDHTYVLDENYEIDYKAVDFFLEKHNGKPLFIFGFTFMIWQYFVKKISEKRNIDFSNGLLVHGGGWKKLIDIAVDNDSFKRKLKDISGISKIYNFYGMVEQVGSVFLENSQGYLHCPNFADVLIRNPKDFSIQPNGKEGLIQVISILPHSYPGFSLLTEDIGVVMGEDDASNGWKGKYFKVLGRAKKSDLRGCSDTFGEK